LGIDETGQWVDCVNMPRFTAANARENAAKAHAARRRRLATGDSPGVNAPQTPQFGPLEAGDAYVARRLARVRAQLDAVDKEIEDSISGDSKRLKELTDAQSRLAEQERLLSGRPLPGSRRPGPERNDRRWAGPPGELMAAPTISLGPEP
jgi:hypothetical protein